MPYDLFVKAQIAGDLLKSDDPLQYQPGLGFYALSPEMQDERVDATTRGFLGLTVACAQCHDHKFDPIPQKDYYSLQGVFSSTELNEVPLAPKDVVEKWDAQKKALDKLEAQAEGLRRRADRPVGRNSGQPDRAFHAGLAATRAGRRSGRETLERWTKYLHPKKEHPYLNRWFELAAQERAREEFEAAAREFQAKVEEVNEEKHLVDEKNKIKLGLDPSRNDMSQADLFSLLDREIQSLARSLQPRRASDAGGALRPPDGVYYYGGKQDRPLPERRMEAAAGFAAQGAGGSEEGAAAAVSVPANHQGQQESARHPRRDSRRRQQSRRCGAAALRLDPVRGRAEAVHERQRTAGTGRGDCRSRRIR